MARLHAIHDEAGLTEALGEYERLLDRSPAPASADYDRLEVLGILIEAYEQEHHLVEDPDDPIAVLEFFMEDRGLTRSDLEPMIGTRSRVAEIMNGRRGFTLEMIRRLHAGLGIPADLLIGKPATFRPELRFTLHLPEGERRSVAAYVRGLLDAAGLGDDVGVRAAVVDGTRRRLVLEAADRSVLERAEPVIRQRFGRAVERSEYLG